MHFAFTPEETAFRQNLRDFLKTELPPDWKGADEYGRTDDVVFERHMRQRLIERDWLTMAWPREYGGQDASNVKMAIFAEEMMYHEAPGKDGSGVGLLAPAVMRHGTPEQKLKYLPPIANGEVTWAQGFSEPESGSDLASLRTRAVKDGDDYLITGQKIWSSRRSSRRLDVRSRPHRSRRPKAPGHYLLPGRHEGRPGITVRPIINMVGDHHFNEEYFDNVRVPAENIIGELNRGWYVAMTTLNFEREGTTYTARARKPLDMLIELLKEARGNGVEAAISPALRNRLAERVLETEVSRLLAYRIAWMVDQGLEPQHEASISKLISSELLMRVANTGMQVLGLMGPARRGRQVGPAEGQTAPHVPLEHQRTHRRRHLRNPTKHNRHPWPRPPKGDVGRSNPSSRTPTQNSEEGPLVLSVVEV